MKRRLIAVAVLALALVTSIEALSRDEIPQPLVRFMDFYADAPKISAWQRVIYGVAIAFAPEKHRK